MTDEAKLVPTAVGLIPDSDGWFVVNARQARWLHAEGRSAYSDFEADHPFAQTGISLAVLEPGQAMAMYHWEADQEDFLLISGEAILIIEGQERPLQAWDFVHCPPGAAHVIVGGGDGPSVIVAVGARAHQDTEDWGAYPVDPAAARYGASAAEPTAEPEAAYAGLARRQPTAYRDGWLP
jgi:uncharacterized cupin superfamily protein